MEVRILQEEELENAAGLSQYVFEACLKSRMEFEQTSAFVEEYLKAENLIRLCREGRLTIWGRFEENQLVAVAGLQSDGLITMLYVLPQCMGRKYGNELLCAMREYAQDTYGYDKVMVNATPASTSSYFASQGFSYAFPQQMMQVPFVAMEAYSRDIGLFKKKHVPGKVIGLSILGCFLFATILAVAYMVFYIQ